MAKEEDLFKILFQLTYDEFQRFRGYLSKENVGDLQPIEKHQLKWAQQWGVVDLMVQKYELTGAVEVMKNILTKINRNDLVMLLSNIDSGTTVSLKKRTWSSTHEDIYPVSETSQANRVALLITHEDIYHKLTREAAEKNEAKMEQLLTGLGYEVVKYNKVTEKTFDEALIEFSKHPQLTQTDSVFVVIISHEDRMWRRLPELQVDKVYKRLNAENCPALLNKPKIIIIILQSNEGADETWMTQSLKEKDFISFVTNVAFRLSNQSPEYGSYVVQYIVEVFNHCAHEDHIEELFRKVMKRLERFPRLMPLRQSSTLTKHFYLFPEDDSPKRSGSTWIPGSPVQTPSVPTVTLSVPADWKLMSLRTQFVHRVSEPVLHELLNELLKCGMITEDEMEEVAETEDRAVKAQVLIDTVRRKGSEASSALISALCELDPRLSTELKLMSRRNSDSDVKLTDPETNQVKPPSSFTPELQTESAQVLYRFRCPGPGQFQCTLTGLVFVMTQEAELQYRTVQWDEMPLHTSGKTPAGPLFSIQCSEDAVCQLHLPHSETDEAQLVEGLLSVVHITDDGMSFLKPLEITDTHVVVRVPHLSAFGLVWALEVLARIWDFKKPISGQVLLFLDPPHPETQKQNLNLFLLPSNIPLEEVKVQHEDSKYIKTPSKCKLVKDETYTVQCPTAHIIQPEKEDFDLNYGPNYHPMFQIRLSLETKEVTVTVRDPTAADIWKRLVDLTGPAGTQGVPAEQKLMSVRTQFIDRVSEPVLHKLLSKLLERGVITDQEMELTAETANRAEKARVVIDMVRRKGSEASSVLISALCEVDPCLSKNLNLTQGQSRRVWTRSRNSWLDFCQLL